MRKRRNFKKKKKSKIRILINIILLTLFTFLLMNTALGIYKEYNIKEIKENYNTIYTNNTEENDLQEEQNKIIQQIRKKEIVDETYKGYKVAAKIEIPKINLITNVLSEYTKEGLDVCVTKFWGLEPNEIGNFCIAGHNMNNEKMFSNLDELEIGDKILLSDNKNGTFEYEIYDIYKVEPENTRSLTQETNGKREVTLITCTNYSNHRIIVKAKECI